MGRSAEAWQEQQDREMEFNQGDDMPQIIRVEGFILKSQYGSYTHATIEMPDHGYITVCPHVLEFEIPETFNPVKAEVDMLNMKLDSLSAAHDRAAKTIKDRISNLLCLEYTPAPVEANDDGLPF